MVALLIIPGDGIFNELSINHTHRARKGPSVWERLFRKHTDEQKQKPSSAAPQRLAVQGSPGNGTKNELKALLALGHL